MTPEQVFLSQLDLIERVIASICRRKGLRGDEAEDFAGGVRLKLIDDDYAVLRKFGGRSKLSTYLTTVVHNCYRDHVIKVRGKWRPSAAARRLGETAVQLEALVGREGLTEAEAVEMLQHHFKVDATREELDRMAARLKPKPPRRFEDDSGLESRPASFGDTDELTLDSERGASADRVEKALANALRGLDEEDRLILRLIFHDGFTVVLVARTLRLPERPLRSRIQRLLKGLRARLAEQGIGAEEVRSLVGWERLDLELDWLEDDDAVKAKTGPSKPTGK